MTTVGAPEAGAVPSWKAVSLGVAVYQSSQSSSWAMLCDQAIGFTSTRIMLFLLLNLLHLNVRSLSWMKNEHAG